MLRAGAPLPLPDGALAGMTAAGRVFTIHPEQGELNDLGPNIADGLYTAAMKASPDGRYLYYAPGAHGSGAKLGAPIVRFDVQRKEPVVLAFLEETLHELGYQIGGSYNLVVSNDGRRLFVTFNGAPKVDLTKLETLPNGKKRKPKQVLFGEPCVLQIDLQ